ncbi:aldose 1-epimerase family protein [Sphingomonas qomolangmaensis]|uniref:Aldose 1-epimerase family protein n=1 Tax=Sphingomonas qomolangmaensis TaxID=2918765 RepID=A0ABY5L747_9SPHN|nr:aldose 1-epimerase family protein [Sphingomonas qomolangmaensis]UUL82617.1 aldose 1-epimerase family protein [Sphingomonas qomolangmaensis]
MFTIATDQLSAVINPLGAELTQLRDAAGNELMTDADPAFWTGHAPILFPIVGALNGGTYRLGDQEYALPQHGLARKLLFELIAQDATSVTLRLTDSEATRQVYPFAFALDVTHAIAGATLTTTVAATNRGQGDMPASIGFHPAFAWPLPYGQARADHRIVFERDEPARLSRIMAGGLIGPADRDAPIDGRTLALNDNLFAVDALVWESIESQSVRYGAAKGPQLRIDFPDTPMLGIWSRPGAAFVCVEPWHGIADPQGFAGEIWGKPGLMRLAPGETRAVAMAVTLEQDSSPRT